MRINSVSNIYFKSYNNNRYTPHGDYNPDKTLYEEDDYLFEKAKARMFPGYDMIEKMPIKQPKELFSPDKVDWIDLSSVQDIRLKSPRKNVITGSRLDHNPNFSQRVKDLGVTDIIAFPGSAGENYKKYAQENGFGYHAFFENIKPLFESPIFKSTHTVGFREEDAMWDFVNELNRFFKELKSNKVYYAGCREGNLRTSLIMSLEYLLNPDNDSSLPPNHLGYFDVTDNCNNFIKRLSEQQKEKLGITPEQEAEIKDKLSMMLK